MSKPNARNFRYSDAVAAVLEEARGESISEKFENLVLDAHAALPALEQEKKRLENEIASLRAKYGKLQKKVFDIESLGYKWDGFYHAMAKYSREVDEYMKTL